MLILCDTAGFIFRVLLRSSVILLLMGIKQNYVCVTCDQMFTRQESGKRHNINLHLNNHSLLIQQVIMLV